MNAPASRPGGSPAVTIPPFSTQIFAVGYCRSARQMAAVRFAVASSAEVTLSARSSKSASDEAVMPSWVVARSMALLRSSMVKAITTPHIARSKPRTGRKIRCSRRLLFRVRVSALSIETASLILARSRRNYFSNVSATRSAAGPPTIRKIVGIMNSIIGTVRSAGSLLARPSIAISESFRISDATTLSAWASGVP